jgi:hypothetical protein
VHPGEKLKPAGYDNEYESQGLWCAASISEFTLPGGMQASRFAFFYVPNGKPRDPLPSAQDSGKSDQCRLLTIWYEVRGEPNANGLFQATSGDLMASLGIAVQPAKFQRSDGDWGSGLWNPYLVWETAKRRVVLAIDPGIGALDPNAQMKRPERVVLIARATDAPRGMQFNWAGNAPKDQPSLEDAAAKLAGLSPALTKGALEPLAQPQSLIAWVRAAQALPRERKAAGLILADMMLDTSQFREPDFLSSLPGQQLTELGANIVNGFDGVDYRHSWRTQAEQLDPNGPAGEIARISHLETACEFEDGNNNWGAGLTRFGEELLMDFPASRWKPYVHLTLARTYAAELGLTYPNIELNGATKPTNPDELRRRAIEHFRAFLTASPDSADADFAWREAWRLLAGLPPSPIHFACTD